MTIPDLIALVEARLARLAQHRATAVALGDVSGLAVIEAEILETETTLTALRAAPSGV